MREGFEYNPDTDPQQRMGEIRDAFESQNNYEGAINQFDEAISKWTREGQQDAALELAQKVELYRSQVEESQPELLNHFDTKLAEVYFYAGGRENKNLEDAEERYQRVAATKLAELHGDEFALTEAERKQYSEVFHALDRLADVAFADGRYLEAGDRYAEAIDKRAEFADDPNEQGPLGCAIFGAAASAFMEGNVEDAQRLTEEALQQLENREADEELLHTNIQALSTAIDQYQKLNADQQKLVMSKLEDEILERGGSGGGVKHFNFESMYDEAIVEANINEDV